jgi:hypothetical protein
MRCAVPGCPREAADRRPVCSEGWRFVPLAFQGMWWRKQPDQFTTDWIRDRVIEYAAKGAPVESA